RGVRWFQLYMHPERAVSASFVERAVDAGYGAILLTVDLPIAGRRERDIHNAFSLPDGIAYTNLLARQSAATAEGPDPFAQVVDAVGNVVPVLMDGGVRRGTDVLKALCLGASGVLVGRPYLYALAVGGAEGVRAMLAMLRDEMAVSMTLLGVKSVSELSEDLLVRI